MSAPCQVLTAALAAPASLLLPLFLNSAAEAQYTDPAGRRWLVIDLGEMQQCTDDHRARFFGHGLNDDGVVVGYATDEESGCFERAWV